MTVMAHGFYHLAAMLLLIFKPAPKFAVKRIKHDKYSLDVCCGPPISALWH